MNQDVSPIIEKISIMMMPMMSIIVGGSMTGTITTSKQRAVTK